MATTSQVLGDRYELTSLIAGGGMGQVWRGRDLLLDRPVAVKVLRDALTGDPSFLARFRAEAQHAALLVHPSIAAVFDYGEVRSEHGVPCAYLVMELVDGESLADVLNRERRLDLLRTLQVVRQAADGLGAAHAAGVVHRDVKPANLLVRRDGVVKVTDFGIARSASTLPITATGQIIGTAQYLSPEQAQGGESTPASDVYALGAVAYECLAGRRPFEGENPVQVALKQIREQPPPLPPDVPVDVRQLVERAMHKDPAARYPDGAALRNAVDRLIASAPRPPARGSGTAVLPALPVPTAPIAGAASGPASGPARPPRRMPLLVAAGAAAAVLVLLAVVLAVSSRGAAPHATPSAASGTTASGTTASRSATPRLVTVSAQQYVGRPVADVQAALAGQGLQVQLVPVQTAGVQAGLVTAVDPAGALAPGTVVRVSYAVTPPPAAPAPQEGHGKKGGGGDH